MTNSNSYGNNSSSDSHGNSQSNNNSVVLVRVASTPNPHAWKFIVDRPVLNEGKATFETPESSGNVTMVAEIFKIDGVKHIHLFANVITVTHSENLANPDDFKKSIVSIIQTRMAIHNPNFNQTYAEEIKKQKRQQLSPELLKIEEILDRTVRPGLQGDGGDIEIVKFEENRLYVNYQGACGTCPSSTEGTLMAIEGILRDEFEPNIQVIPLL